MSFGLIWSGTDATITIAIAITYNSSYVLLLLFPLDEQKITKLLFAADY